MSFPLLGYKSCISLDFGIYSVLSWGKCGILSSLGRNGLEAFPMKYPWPLWVYPILLACLGQSGFCLLSLLWP